MQLNPRQNAVQAFISRSDSIDPFRPAAFRWERASRPFDDDRGVDPLTLHVRDYQEAVSDLDNPSVCPAPQFRLLHRAHRIHAENTEVRWEIEARLLAGQSDTEVAREVGLTRGVVQIFHDVFFVCRDRLHASDSILAKFIGRGPMVGFAPDDLRGVWKWIGYFDGPRKLDAVVAATSKQTRKHAYSEETLESARRLVLVSQIPVTVRFSSLSVLTEIIAQTERMAAPHEATVTSSRTTTLCDSARGTFGEPANPCRPQKLGNPPTCSATRT